VEHGELLKRIRANTRIEENGCWHWLLRCGRGGYGQIKFRRRNCQTHRIAYLVFRGEIPEGMRVLHKCDVSSCCNPEHLWLGTEADNSADMVAKGRSLTGEKNHRFGKGLIGSKNPFAKLTEANITEIFRLRTTGLFQREIAAKFSVAQTTISDILLRKRWKHVTTS
jgi:hypothetical protein